MSRADVKANDAAARFGSGRSVHRVEDGALLAGRGRFVDNVAEPGQTIIAFQRSPHAHARIVSIDTSKAMKLAGVHAVITADDLPNIASEEAFVGEGPMNFRDLSRNCMARGKAMYEGHAVAAVAATTCAARRCMRGMPWPPLRLRRRRSATRRST